MFLMAVKYFYKAATVVTTTPLTKTDSSTSIYPMIIFIY